MRIICPRCVAQYEVDDSSIPETGREVQCANCETIWFQDYIEMLPELPAGGEAAAPKPTPPKATGIFDDLDGKSDIPFVSARSTSSRNETLGEITEVSSDNQPENLLSDADDDVPNPKIPNKPLHEDVRDVLRSEAAFSSMHRQSDAAAAPIGDADNTDPANKDTLSAFLDAQPEQDTPEATTVEVAEAPPQSVKETINEHPDRERLSQQLDQTKTNRKVENTISDIAPTISPTDKSDSSKEPLNAPQPNPKSQGFETADKEIIEDIPTKTASTENKKIESDIADHVVQRLKRNRHAYRADQAETPQKPVDAKEADQIVVSDQPVPPKEEADQRQPKAEEGVARSLSEESTQQNQATLTQTPVETAPSNSSMLDKIQEHLEANAKGDQASAKPEATEQGNIKKAERPANRKALLPDVEELDASLRSDTDHSIDPQEEQPGHHIHPVRSGGFLRAFIWTLLFFAILLALYIFRPNIIEALPQTAVVLNPYAAVVDSLRLLIEGLVG